MAVAEWQGLERHGKAWKGTARRGGNNKEKGVRLTEEAIAELKALEDRRGRLTPQQVVETAEPDNSPLHGFFEWDDAKAGAAYRIEQARELIRRVKIEVTVEDRTFRVVGYVRDPEKEPTRPGYVATMKVTARTVADMMRAELEAVSADLSRVVGLAEAKAEQLPGLAGKLGAVKVEVDRIAAGL